MKPAPNGLTRAKNSASPAPKPTQARNVKAQTSGEDSEVSRLSKEALLSAYRALKEQNEKLSQDADAQGDLVKRHSDLLSHVRTLEDQVHDSFIAQQRMEEELAATQTEKDVLQSSLKAAEKSSHALEKRLKQESSAFEQERNLWQEQESNLKARISKLKVQLEESEQARSIFNADDEEEEGEFPHVPVKPLYADERQEPSFDQSPTDLSSEILAGVESNLTSLRSQYDDLSTQHTSLTSLHNKLMEEISELKQVNMSLMDENESFALLLGERTLNGAILGQGVIGQNWDSEEASHNRRRPLRQLSENTTSEAYSLESHGLGTANGGSVVAEAGARRKADRQRKAPTVGLDLAAELDRAEDGPQDTDDHDVVMHSRDGTLIQMSEDGYKQEIKALRDANKALLLYINKIVERVIASDGFEKILAAGSPEIESKPKISSLAVESSAATSTSKRMSMDWSALQISTNSSKASSAAPSPQPEKKNNRLSFSIASLWSSGGPKSPPVQQNPNLKPMLLSTSQTASLALKRHVEDEDDEEDARQRARLNAELKLMGIETPGSPGLRPGLTRSFGSAISEAVPEEQRQSPSPELSDSKSKRSSRRISGSPRLLHMSPNLDEPAPTSLLASVKAMEAVSAIEQRDKETAAAVKSGQASGFTPVRRVSDRKRMSRSSSAASYTIV